jgi:PPOX class probable F420-dependent enzyme
MSMATRTHTQPPALHVGDSQDLIRRDRKGGRRVTRIPSSHLDLLDRALPTVLTTEMPDGRFQSTVVWCNRDGEDVLLNTMLEFQKVRNLRARPRATVLVVDPDADRWIEVRGVVPPESDGAQEHLDELARLYTGRSEYFGQVVDASLGAVEHPIKYRLRPVRVVTGPVDLLGRGSRSGPLPPLVSAPKGCGEEARIPQTHRGLLERPVVAAMSTRLPSGFAQTQAVWYEPDGNDVLVSTTRERQRGRNLEADPRVTLLVIDPGDSTR